MFASSWKIKKPGAWPGFRSFSARAVYFCCGWLAGLSVLGLLSPCCCCCGVGLEAGFCCSEDAAGLLGVLVMVLNLSKGMSVRTQYSMELWLRAAITRRRGDNRPIYFRSLP